MLKQRSPWLVTLMILGFVLLVNLGIWQTQRGLAKSKMQQSSHSPSEVAKSAPLQALPDTEQAFVDASLAGQWVPKSVILHANRSFNGNIGYEVLQPFVLHSGEQILVNRGWINHSDATLENFAPPSATPIEGTLYQPKKGFTIGQSMVGTPENEIPQALYLDLAAFRDTLQRPQLSDWMLVLDRDHSDSFQRIWKPVVIPPERHYAYAVQWFGLSLAYLFFCWIWIGKKKTYGTD